MLKRNISTKMGAAIIMIVGLMIVGGTLAYLNSILGTNENKFSSTGKVNVGVVEKKSDDSKEYVFEDGSGLKFDTVSSEVVSKIVSIQNIDKPEYPTVNTYVRVRLVPSFVYDSGEHNGETVAANISLDEIKYQFANNGKWIEKIANNGEAYYFYKDILAPGAISDPLLEGVSYSGIVPENSHFELKVLVEGISANSTGELYASAKEAWLLTDGDHWSQEIDWSQVFTEEIKN